MRGLSPWIAAAALLLAACNGGAAEADAASEGSSGPAPGELGDACDASFPCAEGMFCDRGVPGPPPHCEATGECAPVPPTCDPASGPICGCDGVRYESECAAMMAGVATQGAVGCDPPAGMFACGVEFCAVDGEYCEFTLGHGQLESWRCLALVCEGDAAGCACITDPAPCGDPESIPVQACDATDEGGTLLICVPA